MMTAENQPCEFPAAPGAPSQLEARTALVETAVRGAFQQFLETAFPDGMALLATGGFGRRELFPHSDVDLLLLVERAALAERQRSRVSAFLQNLWDAGLRASHSVRTAAECCELDERNVELSISLLDQRFLAGDRGLYARFVLQLSRLLHRQRQRLAFSLCRLARARHARHREAIYELEPNIKESPGGLRDLQLVRWFSQLRAAAPDRLPRPEPLADLEPARDFLFTLRSWIHARAGRDCNLLTFELQEEAAADPAEFMRGYYHHARNLHRAAVHELDAVEAHASPLLVQFHDWRARLANAEFSVSREQAFFRAPHLLPHDPLLILRLFEFVARHGMRPAPETERHVAAALPRLAEFAAAPRPLWPALRELLSLPHAALALRGMHETGVLKTLFPEWERIECLVIRDFYHRYTVDEHTLRAIENLWSLRTPAESVARSFAELFAEVEQPALLTFALLFHDIGKASADAHIPESLAAGETAMERIQMPGPARQTVRALIRFHLDLSAAMNSRDLDDPATAVMLAERVGTLEILKQLTLVTYADISAVNPTALTPWRRHLLWRVYLLAARQLTRELETGRVAAQPPDSAGRPAFLEGFPVRYLRTHEKAEIEAHLGLEQRARERGVAVDLCRQDDTYRLTLVTPDRPFLLASVAGALSSFGMNILKAEGFSNRAGMVLDEFVFADPFRTLELNPPELDRLRLTLERVTLGKVDVKTLIGRRPPPQPPSRRTRVHPAVSFDAEASEAATLIQVIAEDRPGLLYDLAGAISSAGCNIELVLIDTQAHKAIDVFYVTAQGRKLSPAQETTLRDSLLAVCQPAG